jgi:metal-sulfur cluster biosynthetic enzyme/ribosomal protein L22
MGSILAAELHVDEPQLRVAEMDGRAALGIIVGRHVIDARARLRFGPGRTCESVARLLDSAIVRAENAGLDPQLLVVADGSAHAADDIIRVRRKAHGVADWIHSPTCRVQIILRPAGLYATAGTDLLQSPEPPEVQDRSAPSVPQDLATVSGARAEPGAAIADERATAVHEALLDVIDPDLGVNIVDLGFVRAVTIEGRTAVITMTLTSAACPLTGVLENQIRTGLSLVGCVDDFRIDWQWLPAWRPADITDSGREQLRAVGFTI